MGLINGLRKSGITSATPDNILLGAGTVYKNLKWDTSGKVWKGTILGATSGGNKLKIEPTVSDIDIDGVYVKTKGLAWKQGEKASLDVNLAEVSSDALKNAILGAAGASTATGFDVVTTKSDITDTDYEGNIAFVGFTKANKPVIIVMENALCTGGLDLSGKNKDNSVIALTYECNAVIDDTNATVDTLPIFIYYPTAGASTTPAASGS